MSHLHCIREGTGPMVVLSHALGLDLRMWDGVAALLRGDYTLLRYDHRNHGRSECRSGTWAVDAMVEDASVLIRQEAQGEPVHFVGLSLGGMVAQGLAAAHPELLASVVVANSCAHYPDRTPWRTRVEAVRAGGTTAIADGAIGRWLTPEHVATAEGAVDAATLRATLVAMRAEAYGASCEAVAAIDFRESNRRIGVPMLVIAGARDDATPLFMSEEIARAVPGAQLASIDAAHISAAERPAEFAQLLRAFWNNASAVGWR